MSFAKMGLRLLNKRKLRTGLTILAIILGVGILTGVNVTADSIDVSISAQIYATLGNNDIIIRSNQSVNGGWFEYESAKSLIQGVNEVKEIVPRIIKSRYSYPIKNSSKSWNTLTIALNPSLPKETTFGVCNITEALDPTFKNTSKIEELFNQYLGIYSVPIILSSGYAKSFNLRPGNACYIYPENPEAISEDIFFNNTSSWINGTIIGIIQDTSEGVQDFIPPAEIWELTPPNIAVYIGLQTAWEYIFNSHNEQVNMLFTQVTDLTKINSILESIEKLENPSIFPGGIFAENVKSLFSEGITQVNFLMRGIFSILSGISLLVCAIIIKNLLEMSKEEQTLEIGIMRAIGVTRPKIMFIYIVQILFMSIIGSVLGIIFGYFLSSTFVQSYIDTASAVGTDFSNFPINPVITPFTIIIALVVGIGISLLFGFFPARNAANIDPLQALNANSEKPHQSFIVRTIQGTGNFTLALGLLVGGAAIIITAFGSLFLLDIIDPQVIILIFVGVILLVVGVVLLGAVFFPVIIPAISMLFIPFLRKMQVITSRNLIRYSRQTKNTFAMLAIGLCMMITVGTIMNSAYAGAYPGGRTITGGDLRIGDFYRGLVPIEHAEGLRALPSISQVVPIRYSIGFQGLTRIERFGDTIIKFGGIYDSIFGPVQQSFHLGIIDPIEYAQLHDHDSIVQLQDRNVNFEDLMIELNDPYKVVLQDRLSRQLGGLETGDLVRIRFDGFEANFTVVGIFQVLPGIYWSYYTNDDPFVKQFVGLISWKTYESLINDNIGKIDVIARNKVSLPSNYSEYLPEERYWGYVSTPMDYQTLGDLALQTGLINNISRRATSPFFKIPTFQWQTNLTAYKPDLNLSDISASPADEDMMAAFNKTLAFQNVLWHEKGSITTTWNPMSSRAIIIDPEKDQGFGNTSIRATLPQIPKAYRNSLDQILSWSNTNLIGMNVCIVNEIYVNINITTGKFDYVKRFIPGENLRLYFNESIYTDFLVIATTNSHYPYEYVNEGGKHFGDTAVFNYKALSFNPYTADGVDWQYFYEVIDGDPNTIFLSNKFYLPQILTNEIIPNLINQTLGYNQQEQNPELSPQNPLWWINTAIGNMYLLNMTPFSGTIRTDQWIGNYTFDGQNYAFDGAQVTYLGEKRDIPFNITISNGSKILENFMTGNSTFSFDNYTSIMYFDLDDNLTLDDIETFIQTMETVCHTIPSLANISFFAPKLFLLEKSGLFNVYFFIGTDSKTDIDNALQNIESYYALHNLPWRASWNKIATKTEQDVGGFLGLIVNMFFGVLSFALISSLLGLAISTIISVKKRFSEIGTFRTLGFTSGQILTMIIGEGVITAILGIIVGIIAGLLIASLIINNLPFMVFLPILFTPPTETIAGGVGLLLIASVAVNFLPALSAVRIDIAEAIRTKGE